jgi:hypothetical protein
MKSGSLFPTYNAFLKESNKKKLESDLFDDHYDSDSTSQRSLVKSKKRKPLGKFDVEAALKASANPSTAPRESTFLLTELDDEIRRMNGEEYLQSHRNDMAGTLIKDETDLEFDAVTDRISRMKSICNKLLIIQKEKERNILELEKNVSAHHILGLALSYDEALFVHRLFCVKNPIQSSSMKCKVVKP